MAYSGVVSGLRDYHRIIAQPLTSFSSLAQWYDHYKQHGTSRIGAPFKAQKAQSLELCLEFCLLSMKNSQNSAETPENTFRAGNTFQNIEWACWSIRERFF